MSIAPSPLARLTAIIFLARFPGFLLVYAAVSSPPSFSQPSSFISPSSYFPPRLSILFPFFTHFLPFLCPPFTSRLPLPTARVWARFYPSPSPLHPRSMCPPAPALRCRLVQRRSDLMVVGSKCVKVAVLLALPCCGDGLRHPLGMGLRCRVGAASCHDKQGT